MKFAGVLTDEIKIKGDREGRPFFRSPSEISMKMKSLISGS